MSDFFPNLIFSMGVLLLTILIGYPLIYLNKFESFFAKIFLAFTLGFAVISLIGLGVNILHLPVFAIQASVALVLILISVRNIKGIKSINEKLNKIQSKDIFLPMFLFYALILLTLFFSQIIMWAETDTTFHASLVRDILDGGRVPLTLLPRYDTTATYFAAYPKAFHFYTAFFVRLFDIDLVTGIKTVPLVIQIVIPVGIFALLRELQPNNEVALFAFFMVFLQVHHLFPLFFGLYPTITALLFVISVLVFIVGECAITKKSIFNILLLLLTLYLVHPRYFISAIIVCGWAVLWRYKQVNGALFRKYYIFSIMGVGIALTLIGRVGKPQIPGTILIYMVNFVSVFIPQWYLIFLAAPGLMILIARRNRSDRFILGWSILWLSLGILNDLNIFVLTHITARTYYELYLLVSILAGYALFSIVSSSPQIKNTLTHLIILLSFLMYPFVLGSVMNAYTPNLSLSSEDYFAMKTLKGMRGVVINADPTGRWIYPMNGIKVTNPRGKAQLINDSQREVIMNNPSSVEAIKIIKNLEEVHGDVYIFISKKTSSRSYSMFDFFKLYVNVNGFKNSERYNLLYEEDGAMVIKYVGVD